jgi:pimeloyl-ACP methyl ester carboxylesterase
VELQAHGHTSDRDAPESFEQDAADVVALLSYLKINKADFFGFSNGGHTSIQIAIHHPEVVNKLIIVSAFYKREGAVNGFFEGLQNATLDNMPSYLKEAHSEINNDSAALKNMFEKDRARMINFKGWNDEEISFIKAPVLIIAGDKDVVTPEHVAEMNRRIVSSELMILPGNHGSFIGEGPAANENSKMPYAAVVIIEEFLNK